MHFLMHTRLSSDAARAPRTLEELERRVMARIQAQCPEVRWISSWAVLGPCDYVDLFEAPSFDSAARVSAIVRTFGHASTEIWPATPWEHFKELLRDMPAEADWRASGTREELHRRSLAGHAP